MRTPKDLTRTAPTIFSCELDTCPRCPHPLGEAHYISGRKTVQTIFQVATIAYRPKVCVNPRCSGAPTAWPSAAWQRVAPKHSIYGYDVIAQMGWERQKGLAHFATIQAQLAKRPIG